MIESISKLGGNLLKPAKLLASLTGFLSHSPGCHASLQRWRFVSQFSVLLTANLEARVVSAELAVDSALPHHTAGALAPTHLHTWQSEDWKVSVGKPKI